MALQKTRPLRARAAATNGAGPITVPTAAWRQQLRANVARTADLLTEQIELAIGMGIPKSELDGTIREHGLSIPRASPVAFPRAGNGTPGGITNGTGRRQRTSVRGGRAGAAGKRGT